MKPKITLRKALNDPELLGSCLGGPSWHSWRSILLAAMGEELKPDELASFEFFTGRKTAPSTRVDELWCAIGRRGGKSRAMATLAIYLAGLVDHSDKLVRGEKGIVLMIAPDIRQAKVLLEYAQGTLESTPMLSQLIADRTTRDELTSSLALSVTGGSAGARNNEFSCCHDWRGVQAI
jgi:hypothetical protein